MYNGFANLYKDMTFARIFYDEADSINIPNCKKMSAMFYWHISASYNNLLYPQGFFKYNEHLKKYIEQAKGLKNNGYIKDIFSSMYNGRHLGKLIVAKNADKFVEQSLSLPPIIYNKVECKTPYAINILGDIVDANIMRCLNAGDMKQAIQHIHHSHRGSEDNIVSIFIEKLTQNMHNTNLTIEFVKQMLFSNESERTDELKKHMQKIDEYTRQINNVSVRVKEAGQCPICFEDLNQKSIVKCCSNSFCFECITCWLTQHNKCPLCKTETCAKDLYIVESNVEKKVTGASGKRANLIKIVNDSEKVLVFSDYGYDTLRHIEPELVKNNISYAYLKGTSSTVCNIISDYNNGKIKVLLVNPKYCGMGTNLECTTDVILFNKFNDEMENQVIGRAQRYGRKEALNVWYLLYSNEM
jgi:SNF2 family DNA or RNA helicase